MIVVEVVQWADGSRSCGRAAGSGAHGKDFRSRTKSESIHHLQFNPAIPMQVTTRMSCHARHLPREKLRRLKIEFQYTLTNPITVESKRCVSRR